MVGWGEDANDFSTLLPEFLDVLFLLPPRDTAVFETLAALIGGTAVPQFDSFLDVGTGTGLLPELLFATGYCGSLTGIDPAQPLLDYARDRLGARPGIELLPERIQDYRPRPGFTGAALSYMVLHHVPDTGGQYAAALTTVFRALVDGGTFVYVDKLYPATGESAAFDLDGARPRAALPGGPTIEAELSPRNPAPPFVPHPAGLREFHRPWWVAAAALVETGFRIDRVMILNERVVLFTCRKPTR
jgi:SAM-dependent methyltransferase